MVLVDLVGPGSPATAELVPKVRPRSVSASIETVIRTAETMYQRRRRGMKSYEISPV